MGVSSLSFHPLSCTYDTLMVRTCRRAGEIKNKTHPGYFTAVFCENLTLFSVDQAETEMEKKGALAVAKGCRASLATLKELNVSGNAIGSDGTCCKAFGFTPMAVNSGSFGSPHVHPMGAYVWWA